ncbi:biliverdin-producing heme oxygenase [Christiangramia sp. LLG6405-1]|uniref:biliverdin-producing heme oxygenase n=1 Tax=Christiangramia sp. LLG6405-1 TaxID=3160832 RepID=UPI003867BD75
MIQIETMLNKLREATKAQHEDLEGENLANKIMDHSITEEEYKLLLLQNYAAYAATEDPIARHLKNYSSTKTDAIKLDLSSLGIEKAETSLEFQCDNEAEAVGAAYVVEGSAMGGLMIGKELKNCPHLEHLPDQQFFSGKRDQIKSWNEFLKYLRNKDFSEDQKEIAARKAQQTFDLFEEAFKIELIKL